MTRGTSGVAPARFPVRVPGAPYDVVVGRGLLARLVDLVPPPPRARRAAVVTSGVVAERWAPAVEHALRAAGLEVVRCTIDDGEEAKHLGTLAEVYEAFAAIPLGRDDLVVAVGGGVVGDLAGFAAATWNRGVAVVQIPTTLLAQVDAAIGGKTGVNLPAGKNLVGAFHQPSGVVCDVEVLATLPARELRAGLGEVAKYGFIADPEVLVLLERDPRAATSGDPDVLEDLVRRSVAVKARVVTADEREAGERALLNYGHTVGHAIEALTGYARFRHGEAVGLGMVAAARIGERLGVSGAGLAERTVAALRGLGLPTGGVDLDPDDVWPVLARDKKARNGVRFVLCRTPGDAVLADPPPRDVVDEALRSLAAS